MTMSGKQDKPNILIITTDQQSAGMMSCCGTTWLNTPAMDELAAEGVRFENAICANPVCVPSRISIATGVMSCRLGAPDNTGTKAVLPKQVAENSLGRLMKRAGYATFYGGKVHMCDQLSPLKAGYDVFDPDSRDGLPKACISFFNGKRREPFFAVASFINPHDICYVHNAKVERRPQIGAVTKLYRKAIRLPEDRLPPLPGNFKLPDYEPEGIGARESIQAVTPAGTMYRTYDERDWRIYRWVYARLTEQVDKKIGTILEALKDNGLDDNTVVIFTSDHGNMHANHGLASKGVFYEESVGVPFLIKYGGEIPAGRVNKDNLVNIGLDIVPTCCDFAGVDAPAGLLGVSQRGAAESRPDAPTHPFVVSENGNGRMLKTKQWKYTVYRAGTNRESLVDLEGDPGEMKNLSLDPKHANTLAAYRTMMREWFQRSEDEDAAVFALEGS